MLQEIKFKAAMLAPACFAGLFTALIINGPYAVKNFVGLMIFVLPYALVILLLVQVWRRPRGTRYHGHSKSTWTVLTVIAYILGVGVVLTA
jgi:hypothetical protein